MGGDDARLPSKRRARSMMIGQQGEASMLETGIGRLLEDAVNTSRKLAIVMVYAQHANLSASPGQMSQRLYQDIWSVEEAMQELAADGILGETNGIYRLSPTGARREALARLIAAYNDPMRRQEIVRLVGELDSYAPYRKLLNKCETIVAR
jgi:hypothetical protein